MVRLTKLALTAATAVSLAITPLSASAEPGGEDFARALGGLVFLGIVAKAIDDRNDRRRTVTRNSSTHQRALDNRRGTRIIDGEVRRVGEPRRISNRRIKRERLPERCLRVLETRQRDSFVYGSRCLDQRYRFASHLPRACERLVRTSRGVQSFYGSTCLARDGWNVARR